MAPSTQKFAEIKTFIDGHAEELEEQRFHFEKISLAKDKKISSLENEINLLKKEAILAQVQAQKDMDEVIDGAKHSATVAMLKIKLQMAKEAEDPTFDRSAWDQVAWKERLAELDDEEAEVTAGDGAGSSGVKEAAGGEEKAVEAAKE